MKGKSELIEHDISLKKWYSEEIVPLRIDSAKDRIYVYQLKDIQSEVAWIRKGYWK